MTATRRVRHPAADRRARPARPRRAGRRAALRAGRHGRRRPPRQRPARRARDRRHGHDDGGLARHAARVRHDRPRRPAVRRGRPRRRRAGGRAGVLAGVRAPGWSSRSPCRSSPGRSPGPWPAAAGRRRRRGAVAADRRARRARPPAGRRRQRLDARRAGHPPPAGVRPRRQPALRRRSARCWSIRPGSGLVGSAIANVVAQTVAGVLFARALFVERVPRRPRPAVIAQQLVVGRDLLVRGAAFQASFLSATAVAARFGTASVAAHQIGVQLWFFAALVLDAVAIAAQSLIGAALGAGDADAARRLGPADRRGRPGLRRGLRGAGRWPAPASCRGWFTADPAVLRRRRCRLAVVRRAMQPLAGSGVRPRRRADRRRRRAVTCAT